MPATRRVIRFQLDGDRHRVGDITSDLPSVPRNDGRLTDRTYRMSPYAPACVEPLPTLREGRFGKMSKSTQVWLMFIGVLRLTIRLTLRVSEGISIVLRITKNEICFPHSP